MTYKNKHKDKLCLYDYEGKLLAQKPFVCRPCAIQHAPKTTPACVMDDWGKIVWSNEHYEKMKHKVKK